METPETFKRMTGLPKAHFKDLCDKTDTYLKDGQKRNPLKRRGLKKSKLSLEDCLLLTIYYLRHYPTFINLADVFEISESYCHKIYSRYVKILAQIETLPNRKQLLENPPDTLIIDVTEQPIERPVKGQKPYYSGKKKRHTVKVQILASAVGEILSVDCAKGKQHDFSIFKESEVLIHPDSELLADSVSGKSFAPQRNFCLKTKA